MKLLLGIMIWLVVFAWWPVVAVAALILLPLVWLVSLPIRLVVMVVEAVLQLIRAILLLPARVLGARPAR